MNPHACHVGLGLRQGLVPDVLAAPPDVLDFIELAPENWMELGGRFRRDLAAVRARYPIVCHGLSLSLGGPVPLDSVFLARIKRFLDENDVAWFSEHLSYCADDGHLYELLPIPFTEEAVRHVAARVRETQDRLERRIAVENSSYYAVPGQTLSEIDFINAVIAEADCDVLLDINNVYVNSVNHGYDPVAFVRALPRTRVRYMHVAGHERESAELLVDTHGADIADPVWSLLAHAYEHVGVVPTVLERDFNIPPFSDLVAELRQIRAEQESARTRDGHAA